MKVRARDSVWATRARLARERAAARAELDARNERACAAEREAAPARAAKAAARAAAEQRWVEAQRARGWTSWSRAAYALLQLRVAWERADEPPARDYMCSWWEATRRSGGFAPEDVSDEILELIEVAS